MSKKNIGSNARFITRLEKNDDLLNSIIADFRKNLDPYLMSFKDWKTTNDRIEGNEGISEN
jgi:hypothetical protein